MSNDVVPVKPIIPSWRIKNIEKAREARRKKLLDEKTRQIEEKVDGLSKEVDKRIDESIDKTVKEKVDALMTDIRSASNLVKQAFIDAFEKSGGVDELVSWVTGYVNEEGKLVNNNRKEYYKLLISLLKAEMSRPEQEQKQGVIVNIIGLNKEQNVKVEVDGEKVE
jgi:hypothetical protein